MKAALLIGGKAERLRPLTTGRPKAMVPLLGQPFLGIQLELLREAGFTDIVLCHASLPRRMAPFFGDGRDFGVHLTWSLESRQLGTGGALGLARSHLTEPFLCLNGDVLTDLDLRGLVAAREKDQAILSLAVTRVEDASSFGAIRIGPGASREVRGFHEKSASTGDPGDVNLGAYAMTPEIFDLIPENRPVSLEAEVFPAAIGGNRRVTAFRHDGYFADIGTPGRYLEVHRDALVGRIRIPGIGKPNPGGMIVDATARVHNEARLLGPGFLGTGARVAARATIGPGTVLGPRVRVEEDATIEDSVLWSDARIGEGALVRRSILGTGAFVGPGARVIGAALGDKSAIPAQSGIPWDC